VIDRVITSLTNIDDTQVKYDSKVSAEAPHFRREKGEAARQLERLELELAEYKSRLKIMTSMYEDLCNSLSWMATAPVRRVLDRVQRMSSRVRARLRSGDAFITAYYTTFEAESGSWLGGLYQDQKKAVGEQNASLAPAAMREFLYVYHSASFGGVERVLLNRAEAFRRHNVPCRISVYFRDDCGALPKIRDYIGRNALERHIRIVESIDASLYDYVVCVDTPEVLRLGIPLEKVIVECHTTYQNGLLYLVNLPDRIRHIFVPSHNAELAIADRFPHLRNKLRVVRNFIPTRSSNPETDVNWKRRPLLYLGRINKHKNYQEVLDIFQCYRSAYADDLFLMLVGPVDDTEDLGAELARRNIADRTVVLAPVPFDAVWQVLATVRQQRGVFVSSSTAESFGLSAAEALSAGLPVILSGIGAHVNLVAGSLEYLYPLGDPEAGAGKLSQILQDYDNAALDAASFGKQFSEDNFLEDWQNILTILDRF